MNHSIPETFGLAFKHKEDLVSAFFISDFKVDDHSPYEKLFDFNKLRNLTKNSQERILLADSTNILSDGQSLSEGDLIKDLETVIAASKKRTFITLFSSNIHRIQSIVDICKKQGKKLTFIGRSIYKYTDAAIKTHHLHNLESVFINDSQARELTKDVVILLTGCQGDFFGSLRRLANGELTGFNGGEGDRVIFSSKVIPGNEKKVYKIYNDLTEKGMEIISAKDFNIHASGHARKEELARLTLEYDPTHYIPIHGETFFLKRHCEFINERFPNIKTHFIKNFSTISISHDFSISLNKQEELEPELIHGDYLKITREAISKRRKLATRGVVFVTIKKDKKFLNFQVTLEGLPKEALDQQDNLRLHLKGICKPDHNDETLEENVRINSKRFLSQVLGYRPEVITHIT